MSGGAQEELHFRVVDGQCIRGVIGPVEGVCGDGITHVPTGMPTQLSPTVLTNVLESPPGPHEGTGIYITIYDQYGDGWRSDVNISYFVNIRGLDSNTISTGLVPGESVRGGLLPVTSLPYNHRYYLSLAAFDDFGNVLPVPEYYWEIHWSVQFVQNGAWGRKYYGGYDTEMVIDYRISTRSFRFEEWQNMWIYPEGCADFCNYHRVTETLSNAYFSNFVDSGIRALGDTAPSSAAVADSDFLEAGWYITDIENKTILYGYGKPYCDASYDAGGGVATTCKTCIADGEYIFRVTGANDPDADMVEWEFCGYTGGAQTELRFTITNGGCSSGGFSIDPPPPTEVVRETGSSGSSRESSLSVIMIVLISGFALIALAALWFCLAGAKQKSTVVSPFAVSTGGRGAVVPEDVF